MVPFLPCDFTTFRVFFLMCFVSLLIFKFFSFVLYNVGKFYFNFYQKTKFSLQQHSKNMKNIRKNITLFKKRTFFELSKQCLFTKKMMFLFSFFIDVLLFWFCLMFFFWFLYYFGFAILFLAFPSVILLYKQKNDENKQTKNKQIKSKQPNKNHHKIIHRNLWKMWWRFPWILCGLYVS